MKKNQLELTPEQYRLALYAVSFAQGAMRKGCQFEVADALSRLGDRMAEQQGKFLPPPQPVIAIRKKRANG